MGKETVKGENDELCQRLNTQANYSLILRIFCKEGEDISSFVFWQIFLHRF